MPDDLVGDLDDEELAPLSPDLDEERRSLEQLTRCHVAAYLEGVHTAREGQRQLCSLLLVARLDADGLSRIGMAESRHRGIVFVAYARPPVRRHDSAI